MPGLDFGQLLLIALGLSADCFAVSLGLGASGSKSSTPVMLRIGISFGFFQAAMPALGWLFGNSLLTLVAPLASWVAFVILAIIGGRMLWEGIRNSGHLNKPGDYTRGWLLVGLAVATSIDAMAAGISFSMIGQPLQSAIPVVGITAFTASVAGYIIGNRSGRLLGRWALVLGGIVLIGIGLNMVAGVQ